MNQENLFLLYLHNPQVPTWDDYAIMSIMKSGLGISILPELISERIPYMNQVYKGSRKESTPNK
ncbi:hypothetical protein RSJ5_14060 [Clostridium botulinum]|nr:hypothetical protein RSJ5_14060 [Clostridium botulinum]